MKRSREWFKRLSKVACMAGLALVVVTSMSAAPRNKDEPTRAIRPDVEKIVTKPARESKAKAQTPVAQDQSLVFTST